MSEKDLLPCPCCGGDAAIDGANGRYWVECAGICCVMTSRFVRVESAVENWNRRPTAPPSALPDSVRRDAEELNLELRRRLVIAEKGWADALESLRAQPAPVVESAIYKGYLLGCQFNGQKILTEKEFSFWLMENTSPSHPAPAVGMEDTAHLAQLQRIEVAAKGLIAKLDEIHAHPLYKAVWQIAQIHQGQYTGPQYVEEMEALRAALASLPSQPGA